MHGEERHLNAFRAEEESERCREVAAEQLLSKGLPKAEADALRKVETDVDELDKLEIAVVE